MSDLHEQSGLPDFDAGIDAEVEAALSSVAHPTARAEFRDELRHRFLAAGEPPVRAAPSVSVQNVDRRRRVVLRVGGLLAAFFTNRGILSLGSLVGLLAILGIGARSGIVMIALSGGFTGTPRSVSRSTRRSTLARRRTGRSGSSRSIRMPASAAASEPGVFDAVKISGSASRVSSSIASAGPSSAPPHDPRVLENVMVTRSTSSSTP